MPDITNLFRHDVEMGSSLNIEQGLSSAGLDVYGDSVMYGDLEVSGSLSAPRSSLETLPLREVQSFGGKPRSDAALKCAIVSNYPSTTFGRIGSGINNSRSVKIKYYAWTGNNNSMSILSDGTRTTVATSTHEGCFRELFRPEQ